MWRPLPQDHAFHDCQIYLFLCLFPILELYLNKMTDQNKKPDLGLLEEDDEFEEFPAEGRNKHV